MPDLELIWALTPMVIFYAGVLLASAWIAPKKASEKEPKQ